MPPRLSQVAAPVQAATPPCPNRRRKWELACRPCPVPIDTFALSSKIRETHLVSPGSIDCTLRIRPKQSRVERKKRKKGRVGGERKKGGGDKSSGTSVSRASAHRHFLVFFSCLRRRGQSSLPSEETNVCLFRFPRRRHT